MMRLLVVLLACPLEIHAQCSSRSQAQCFGDCNWNGATCSQICFQEGTAYTPDMSGQSVVSLGSREQCKQRCQSTAGCAHFTFYANGNCHLHPASAARQGVSGATSGQASCQETSTAGNSNPTAFAGGAAGNVGSGGSAGNLGAGPGNLATESMPSNVGSAMRSGSSAPQNSFSGLSSLMLSDEPLVPATYGRGSVAAGSGGVLLIAFAVVGWRRRASSGTPAQIAEE